MENIKFKPHSHKQDQIIFSDELLTVAATGTQFGKSIAGALWLKRQVLTVKEKNANFLLMAPTYKIMNQSMVPYFVDRMRGLGEYKKADAVFECSWGPKVFMRTEKDPDSIVGIPRVKAYWLDEAGKVSLYFWENIQARAASVGAKGLLTTSPYSRNWLYKQFIKKYEAGVGVNQTSFIKAASWENPYHTMSDIKERERVKLTMDPRRFDMLFGGEWGKMIGLVYDCFDEDLNTCEPFYLPQGTKFYGGIDWGYTEPFVLTVRAVTPEGEQYQVAEFYKSGLTLPMQIEAARQKKVIYNIECFFAGPDQPGSIEEFNRNGLPCVPADNDVRRGIDAHYELFRSRKLKIFKGSSPNTLDELESYHYPEPQELDPDDNVKDAKPVQQNDHALDSGRYLSIMLKGNINRLQPKNNNLNSNQETVSQRIERLKRKSKLKHAEKFS